LKSSLRSKLDSQAKRLEELNRLLSAEGATRDLAEFRKLSREHAELTQLAEIYGRYRQAERDGQRLHWAVGDLLASPARAIGLGDDAHHMVRRVHEMFERRHGEAGRSEEHHP